MVRTYITGAAEFRVSFGTKVIHALGYKESGLQPLVYDLFVYKALKKLHETDEYPYSPQHPWRFMTSESYGKYCGWADGTACRLGAQPAEVECALFDFGKRLSQQNN